MNQIYVGRWGILFLCLALFFSCSKEENSGDPSGSNNQSQTDPGGSSSKEDGSGDKDSGGNKSDGESTTGTGENGSFILNPGNNLEIAGCRVSSFTDSENEDFTSVKYDQEGRISEVRWEGDFVREYAYSGNTIEIIEKDITGESEERMENRALLTVEDAHITKLEVFEYDEEGQQWESTGSSSEIKYGTDGLISLIKLNLMEGDLIHISFTWEEGNLVKEVREFVEDGETEQEIYEYTYDENKPALVGDYQFYTVAIGEMFSGFVFGRSENLLVGEKYTYIWEEDGSEIEDSGNTAIEYTYEGDKILSFKATDSYDGGGNSYTTEVGYACD